jgi:hypothetical protein
MNIVIILIVGAVICGIVGALLGGTVNKRVTGWWLGFLLGPIGWIIVLLLPRDGSKEMLAETGGATDADGPPCERDLLEDGYKIWLVEKYCIQRNEALNQFVCRDSLFQTIEDALAYADSIEEQHQRQEQQEAENREVQELDQKKTLSAWDSARERNIYIVAYVMVGIIIVVAVLFN